MTSIQQKFAMLPTDINFDSIKLCDKISGQSGRTVYANYNGESMVVETPYMKLPYGISIWPNEGGVPDRHSINMSFSSDFSSKDELNNFSNFIKELDTFFVDEFFKNSSSWKQKTYKSIDVVNELYNPMFKPAKETDKYPPTFKLNMPCKDGCYMCPIVDSSGKQFNFSKANSSGAHVKAIIKCVGLWLAGGKFGCTWRIMNLMVLPKDNGNNFQFRDMMNSIKSIPPTQPKHEVIDTDEDDVDEDDPVDVPTFK